MTQLKILLACIGLVCAFTNCTSQKQSTKSPPSKTVTEVAAYRIETTKNKNFNLLLTEFRRQVAELEGYNDYLTLQDLQHQNIYIDILHWDDIDLALAASEEVKNGEKYKPFTTAIDSLIAYGEFYTFKSFTHKKVQKMTDKITEVVIYKIKGNKVQEYAQIAEAAHAFLSKQKGFNSREILQDHKEENTFMDIVIWDSAEDAQNAMQASQNEPSLMPFFQATEEIVTFSHYKHFK